MTLEINVAGSIHLKLSWHCQGTKFARCRAVVFRATVAKFARPNKRAELIAHEVTGHVSTISKVDMGHDHSWHPSRILSFIHNLSKAVFAMDPKWTLFTVSEHYAESEAHEHLNLKWSYRAQNEDFWNVPTGTHFVCHQRGMLVILQHPRFRTTHINKAKTSDEDNGDRAKWTKGQERLLLEAYLEKRNMPMYNSDKGLKSKGWTEIVVAWNTSLGMFRDNGMVSTCPQIFWCLAVYVGQYKSKLDRIMGDYDLYKSVICIKLWIPRRIAESAIILNLWAVENDNLKQSSLVLQDVALLSQSIVIPRASRWSRIVAGIYGEHLSMSWSNVVQQHEIL